MRSRIRGEYSLASGIILSYMESHVPVLKIALLGKIPKGDAARKEFTDWKAGYREAIVAKVPQAVFLDGDLITDDNGPELCVGHDLWMVKHADVLVVDAREKIGAGTAQEMVFAKLWKKPLVSVIPRDSHHRKSNLVVAGTNIPDWIHPFLFVASDYVGTDITDAAQWIASFAQGGTKTAIKGIEAFEQAIDMFERDMVEMVARYQAQGW